MMKPTKWLSVFDGKSCGRLALQRAGIPVKKYYASEVDKYAIAITKANWPDTEHVGDIRLLKAVDFIDVDGIIGGSPCQGFSFAGKMKGAATECGIEITTLEHYMELKAQDFQFNGQSYLFWEYVRLWREIQALNPHRKILFFLENVRMVEKWKKVINNIMGVEPLKDHKGKDGWNSSWVSAQNRVRMYWTNFDEYAYQLNGSLLVPPPDRGILLRDVLENNVDEKYYLTEKMLGWLCAHSDKKQAEGCGFKFTPKTGEDKANTVNQRVYKMGVDDNYVIVDKDGTFVLRVPEATKQGYVEIEPGGCFDAKNSISSTRRGRKMEDKSNCLMAKTTDFMQFTQDYRIRRLTPTECERLQTVPDGYTAGISDTQRYKMSGNGWTVDMIAHIFSLLRADAE